MLLTIDIAQCSAFQTFVCYDTLIHSEFGCGTRILWNRKPTFHKPCNESYVLQGFLKTQKLSWHTSAANQCAAAHSLGNTG